MNLADAGIWATGFCLELIILSLFVRRRLAPSFPCFCALVSFLIFRSVALFCVLRFGSSSAYFYAYYFGTAVEYALRILAITEIMKDILSPAWFLPRASVFFFAIISLLALGLSWYLTSGMEFPLHLVLMMRRIDWSISFVIATLLIAIGLYREVFLVSFRSTSIGLMGGFGVSSLLSLLVQVIQFKSNSLFFSQLKFSSWILAYLWWIASSFGDVSEGNNKQQESSAEYSACKTAP